MAVFFCFGISIYAQNTNVKNESQAISEQSLIIPDAQGQSTAVIPQQTNTVWLFIRLILVLAAVIACIYLVVFLLKKASNPKLSQDPYLKQVASLVLAPGKSVHVVSLGSQAFLVGVAETSVSLLGEITDKELIDAMNLQAEKTSATGKARDFASILSSFIPGQKNKIQLDSVNDTENYLRQQRERLKRSDQDEGDNQ